MTKNEFLFELGQRLSGLPKEDIVASLDYYSELIDDHIENGMSEEEAVDSLGDLEEIVSQIIGDTPLPKLVKEKIKPKRALRVWEIVLLILGSPIWLSLLIALFAVLIAIAVTIFSVIISFFAVDFAFAAAGVGLLALSPVLFVYGKTATALAYLGFSLILLGSAPLLFIPLKKLAGLVLILCKKTLLLIKRCFVGKEAAK